MGDVPHLTPDEFREHGHALVEWIASYAERVRDLPVQAPVQPGDVRARVPDHPPDAPEDFGAILADLDDVVLPGISHWTHPGWFAYFPTGASFPSVLAEFVSAALGAQGMLWSTSPALTEVETAVLDWLVDLLGLPPSWRMDTGPGGGVIQMSASDSTHVAMVAARERAVSRGHDPADLVLYASSQAHSSIEKGARVAGFREWRLIDVDRDFALRPDRLADQVAEDRSNRLVPAMVCSTVGTTSTAAVDNLAAVEGVARSAQMWHHVDAAYAGSAMVCPEFRQHQAGVEDVDSYVFNPHKWLLTNFDCSVLWVADRSTLVDTLAITPPYLRNQATESGQVVDYRDWHVPLGRRFRALKLWWVIRSYGREGLQAFIRQHHAWARELHDRLDRDPRYEVIAPTHFALVSFRHVEGDEATDNLVRHLNADGSRLVLPSTLKGRRFVRVSIGAQSTTSQDVEALWASLDAFTPWMKSG